MTTLSLLDFAKEWLLNLDEKLQFLVGEYKNLTYLILFAIVFVETGLVVMPLLPGDSLLFAAGSIAAMDGNPLNIFVLIPLLILAALLGDNTNYFIGSKLGCGYSISNGNCSSENTSNKPKPFMKNMAAIPSSWRALYPS